MVCGVQYPKQAMGVIGNRYHLTRMIAQGGTATVWEARDWQHIRHRVAIKELDMMLAADWRNNEGDHAVEMFRREFQLLSQLSHPNLIEAYDYISLAQKEYFVMEYVDGMTLEYQLELNRDNNVNLPPKRFISWVQQFCKVLDYLHNQSPPVIYRDLKPDNVMLLNGSDHLKLLDFGIARFHKPGKTQDTIRVGTPGYVAPELMSSRGQSNAKTDIFALGVLLHEFASNQDLKQHLFTDPYPEIQNSKLSRKIKDTIFACLELDARNRPASGAEILEQMGV